MTFILNYPLSFKRERERESGSSYLTFKRVIIELNYLFVMVKETLENSKKLFVKS